MAELCRLLGALLPRQVVQLAAIIVFTVVIGIPFRTASSGSNAACRTAF